MHANLNSFPPNLNQVLKPLPQYLTFIKIDQRMLLNVSLNHHEGMYIDDSKKSSRNCQNINEQKLSINKKSLYN